MTPKQTKEHAKTYNFLIDNKSDTENTEGGEKTLKMHFNIIEKQDKTYKEKWWQ